ncbi:hypothetical protein [Limosilactobacillus caccae]|uniref:hypothetical protein n=1 Tax=Limosilactobacillus caccae TaxID=1926284 RepID=UPI000970D4D4|nr:hypothetical protein [Limosilactobacillus caccae]
MKIEKQAKIPVKGFISSLKELVKPSYLRAMWPIAGISIIFFAVLSILSILTTSIQASMTMSMMMMMYGAISPLSIAASLIEILLMVAIIIALSFGYSFFSLASQYTYLDKLAHPEQPVSAGSIWLHFKHLRKNQVLRIALYIALFTFLWSLPLNIVANLVSLRVTTSAGLIAVQVIRLINDIIIFWKSIEYSQAYFLYREKQPQFLGQSMRHALTASRRFMTGRKWNYFGIILLVDVLPIVIWALIFGGLAYYGIYTATYVLTYVGLIVFVLGLACYLPVIFATGALYYNEMQTKTDVDVMFKETFKPVAELTGEAYVHELYVEDQAVEQTTSTENEEHEAKKDK